VSITLQRDWLAPPVDWRDPAAQSGFSREDIAVFLARGTPRRFKTLYSNVSRLPPGFALRTREDGNVSFIRTWSALQGGSRYFGLTLDERASHLRTLLQESVRRQSDGKRVGLLLSGGYDSTLLATLMARDGIDVMCYTVEAPGRYPSEWEHARETASRLEIPIRRVIVTLADLLESTTVIRPWKRSPNVCWVTANQLAASRAAAEDGCDVVLMGTGSDELLGPSTDEVETIWRFGSRTRSIGEAGAWSVLLGEKSKDRTDLLYKGNISAFAPDQLQMLFPDMDVADVLEEDVVTLYRELHEQAPNFPYESLTLQLELEMRSSDVIMHELTAASQAQGMPVAFPFYDRSLAEFAASIPLDFKANRSARHKKSIMEDRADWTGVTNKYLLRYAFKHLIPDSVNSRPRLAYTLPFSWWMRGEDRRLLMDCIKTASIWEKLGISREALAEFAGENLGEGNLWRAPLRFWLLYQLSIWERGKWI
jgi:asparagine synthase (glutamine-hydrolysing)